MSLTKDEIKAIRDAEDIMINYPDMFSSQLTVYFITPAGVDDPKR